MRSYLLLILLAALGIQLPRPRAADSVRLESRYLGDGAFEYVLEYPDDRYFETVHFDILQFAQLPPEFIEYVETPDEWHPVSDGWRQFPMGWVKTPYRCVFRLQSPLRGYRRSLMTVAWSQRYYPWLVPMASGDDDGTPPTILASAYVDGLVPCLPSQADGSDPELTRTVPGFPELRIESLLMSQGVPVGIAFRAGAGLPLTIEATHDLHAWTPIGSTVSTSGVTTWRFGTPPDPSLRYFRIVVKQ